jgi:hypothetical protein
MNLHLSFDPIGPLLDTRLMQLWDLFEKILF